LPLSISPWQTCFMVTIFFIAAMVHINANLLFTHDWHC
jgi:hypothetical protein